MPALLLLALELIVIFCLAYGGFWLVGKMQLPAPASLIGRVIVGVIAFLLLLGLFVPSLGIAIRLPH
jgi:hypothetical protein